MKLESFISNTWVAGSGAGRPLVNPVTGAELAYADTTGLDVAGAMDFARTTGGNALRGLSFAQRGVLLNAVAGVLIENRDRYEVIARENSGNTKLDASIDIDGGIGTLKYYARLSKSLGDAQHFVEEGRDQLARDPVFFTQHLWTTRPGIAVHINAYNFPSWGLWEKVATSLLAGVPAVAKPATATALLSYEMVRDVIAAKVLPIGALSLICGQGDALLTGLGPMDSIAFTGSASTGLMIRSHTDVLNSGARITIEADSVNGTIIGADVAIGSTVFDLAVREVVKALSVKAGQLCTNIRRVFVPKSIAQEFADAVSAKLATLSVGDPADDSVRIGPLINAAQRDEANEKVDQLLTECREAGRADLGDVSDKSGFVVPRVLVCNDPANARIVHEIEVFGPCVTVLAYDDLDQAISLATAAQGSLALSVFSNDLGVQSKIALSLAAWHGRILFVDEEVGKNHTGHSIVMPQCVHGGPGRAGGGEELGGLRGLRFHMQRTAIQGGSGLLDSLQVSGQLACL